MRSASWPRGRGTASRGAASSQSMMSAPWPPIPSRRSRVAPSAAAWAGLRMKRRLLDFFPDEGIAEVFRPALADGLRFRAFGEHEERHVSLAAGLVEDLALGRLVVDPDRLDGREFLPAGDARDGEPLPVRVLPDRTEQLTRPAGLVSALRPSSLRKAGSVSSGR